MERHESVENMESQPFVDADTEDFSDSTTENGVQSISVIQLILLTTTLGGLQTIFCVEFSLGSIHLLSLGISKPVIAIIWLSGPIAGVFVQPYFGIWSDNSRLRWGRRRPFIAYGAVATILSLLGFAWVKTVVDSVVLLTFGSEGVQQHTYQQLLITWATLFICFLNIAIQAVQCGARALIVDRCPPHQQDRANACASCMIGIGNIISYSIGSFDLSNIIISQDEAQVKGMSLLASSILGLTVWLTCISINEDGLPSLQSRANFKSLYALEMLKQIFAAAKKLSTLSKRVYIVQFFSWMGWFAFLTYNTVYTRKIYMRGAYATNSYESMQQATRLSSKALLFFAIVSMAVSFVVLVSFHCLFPDENKEANPAFRSRSFKPKISKRALVVRLWTFSHILFTLCMFGTYLISSSFWTTAMVALTGISWAVATWAPFTLIAMDVSSKMTINPLLSEGGTNGAGIMIGLLNVAICLPQIVAVAASTAIFWWLGDGNNNAGIVCLLNFGGVSALVAAYFCMKIRTGRDQYAVSRV